MAPASNYMAGNACGCRMSTTYRWDAMTPRINTKGDRVLYTMAPHTSLVVVRVMCRCKVKAGLWRSPRSLYTRTRLSSLLRLNLNWSLKTNWFHSTAV
ncbi:uncharacterized protein TNCV_771091 [Trichonephila clavipes]|nr:uncharacterized protein TNCV_771091 [Trichonephila clavipes]